MTINTSFYKDLKILSDFSKVGDFSLYADVPSNWSVVATDVVKSTQAIEQGRYKDVNTVGAAFIIAVQNTLKDIQIPFIFGGDGAFVLIPSDCAEIVTKTVQSVQMFSKDNFGLDLRAAIIPVSVLREYGKSLKIAKFYISDLYQQALMVGDGLDMADRMMRLVEFAEFQIECDKELDFAADYTGLTCRWQDVPSKHGEMLSLIVKAENNHDSSVYQKVVNILNGIYEDIDHYKPIQKDSLQLSFNTKILSREAKLMTAGKDFVVSFKSLIYIFAQNVLGKINEWFGVSVGGFSMDKKRSDIIFSTDYKKFDGTLKLVIASDSIKRTELTRQLDELENNGLIKYGLHITDRALLTCLVFRDKSSEVHFVDGADGGYALAAKQLKMKLSLGV